jgi:hypothetical protein
MTDTDHIVSEKSNSDSVDTKKNKPISDVLVETNVGDTLTDKTNELSCSGSPTRSPTQPATSPVPKKSSSLLSRIQKLRGATRPSEIENITTKEAESKTSGTLAETSVSNAKVKKKKYKNSGMAAYVDEMEVTPLEYQSTDPDYATWLPPDGQSGDGKTSLNAKYGY